MKRRQPAADVRGSGAPEGDVEVIPVGEGGEHGSRSAGWHSATRFPKFPEAGRKMTSYSLFLNYRSDRDEGEKKEE